MGPIRKLAGFHANNKFYFNTRTEVEPPEILLKNTPIGSWIYSAYDGVCDKSDGRHQTAIQLLRFLIEMNKIFVQDATALLLKFPDRRQHALYDDLDVFALPEFEVSFL